ncbi:MAG: hypothetical protein H7A25_06850 [Leptospiraceae bacterium]|nr:hypothetical protein [Leptospiraceae bacterium]MCP5499605.1 hypothetical protein [Leptospiraceae bacterium]
MNKLFLILPLIIPLLYCDRPDKKLYDTYHENVSGVELNDETIKNYIKVTKALHKFGKGIPEKLAKKGEGIESGTELFKEIETAIKEGGFKSFADYVRVNAKIAWAWNVSQGEIGMLRFDKLQKDSEKQLIEAIHNPDVPQETKEELKKSLKQLQDSYKNNKKYADIAMKFVRPLTNDKDLAIIKKYQKELMEAYTGIPIQQLEEIQPSLFLTD